MHNGKRFDTEVKSGGKVIYSEFAGIEIEIQAAEMLVPVANDTSAIIS
jgi:co-chaperonin GroES (HSP10)